MRPVVVTAILLLVVLMSTSDSAAGDPAEMCRTKYPVRPCKVTDFEDDWFYMGDNHCVKVFYDTEHLGFFDAEDVCTGYENGHLVSIHNDLELNHLQCAMYRASSGKAQYWIGAFFTSRAGLVWVWTDDTKFDYKSWAGGQPDNKKTSQLCVEMNYWDWGLWNDVGCNEKRPYVCAVKIQ